MVANGLPQKGDSFSLGKGSPVGPASQCLHLWGSRLMLVLEKQWMLDARIKRLGGFSRHLAECAREHGTLVCLSGDCRDPGQLAAWLSQEIGQRHGIINIRANVGIIEHLDRLWICHLSS